jgi:catechol 2,3-dioxygenase-like lactoylglutathione lyase family enzyme
MIKKLNHIGISVLDIEKTMDLFTSVFKADSPGIRERDDLKSSFPLMGDALLEVIEPKTSEGIKTLKKRGEGISHLCFEVDNIEEEVKSWVAKGLRLRGSGIRNRPGRKVAFFEPADTFGVTIQLVQFEKDRTGSPY